MPPKMKMNNEKAKDFNGTIKKLFSYLKPYYSQFLLVVVFASGSTIFSIFGPKILAKATDKLTEGIILKATNSGTIDFKTIGTILFTLALIYILSTVLNGIQGFMTTTISQKVSYDFRKAISEKMNRLPLTYFDKHSSGDILSRVTNDVDLIAHSLHSSMTQIISSSVTLVGVLVMMLSINVVMTFMALCVLPVSMFFMGMIMKKTQKYFVSQQKSLGNVNGHIEEMYGAHHVVKAFNGESASVEKFQEFNNELYDSAWKSQFFSGLMQPITAFVGNVCYVGVCLIGGIFASGGKITIGDIQAFTQYVRQFNQPVTQVAQIANQLQSTAAAAERVFEFLDEAELEKEMPVVTKEEYDNIKGSVTFSGVKFGYNPDTIVINDFSMHVHAGQSVAIVGPTGAGKTTIVKLLMRFYELNEGEIYIDGFDIKDFSRHDLRKLFGMVLQDTWLFGGTIKENLRYGRLDATDEEIKKACELAYADHFIDTLEDGYETIMNEESTNISQGQKQLLTIARAFLADPKILILDEATSSVDTRTETLIQKGMDKLMEGRTCFIIAHRLSTIKDANTIIVMKDGDIVELGNHEELLIKDGFYASLYKSQFESGNEE